jgi:hypothetical protein
VEVFFESAREFAERCEPGTVHILFNTRYLFRPGAPPFLPPAEGWLPQTVHLLNGMAFSDLINAIVALIFVYGYFARAKWHLWLGTLTLTIRRLFLPMGQ